jgi:hypothetical protein
MKKTYVPKEKELFPEKEELSPMRAIKIALIVYFIKLNNFILRRISNNIKLRSLGVVSEITAREKNVGFFLPR